MSMIKSFLKNESGATAAEYALILAAVAVTIAAAAGTAFKNISGALTSASSGI